MDTISVVALAVTSGVMTGVTAATTIPGLNVLNDLGSALRGVLVAVGTIAFVVSAIGWFATKGTSPQVAGKFMGGMVVALAGVMLGTAAPTIVDWAQGLGNQVK